MGICKNCGKQFIKKVHNQQYCSATCTNRFWSKDYYQKNREKILHNLKSPEKRAHQRKLNKTTQRKNTRNKRLRERVHTDPIHRLRVNINRTIRKKFPGMAKFSQLENYLGFTLQDLWEHLKKTIPDGFDEIHFLNGTLEIDHIIPQSAYYTFTPGDEEFRKCWNLQNLRLFERIKNIKKHETIDWFLIDKLNLTDIFPASIKDIILNKSFINIRKDVT